MATYFHGGSEIQATPDGIHTLYLMNPNNIPFQQSSPSMLFLNPALNPLTDPPANHHFVGIPLPTTVTATDNIPVPGMSVPHGVRYNLWSPSGQSTTGIGTVNETLDMGFQRQDHLVSPAQKGQLSLSLSSEQTLYRTVPAVNHDISGNISPMSDDVDIRGSGNSPMRVSASSNNGIIGVQDSVVLVCKYIKAAQELLDEVVNVGMGNMKVDKKEGEVMKGNKRSEMASINGGESSSDKKEAELGTAQRQEIQMKKAKLINMLDEVERRYRQYHQQMQVVVSAFEHVAGLGSAKSYTALALKTISKQFRCLKDAISVQIKAISMSLGEQDYCLGIKMEGSSSRLRYVDNHFRQQRTLQQLGMIHNNTWRPQRGLPERAVSVLRAWLFEHFLHPYPKDSDKIMLAKQTGLTRSQVSNWFINARVRLWKPMVEEMYLEEIKEQDKNGSNKTEEPNKDPNEKQEKFTTQNNGSLTDISNSSLSSSPILGSLDQTQSSFNFVRSPLDHMHETSPKKPRNPQLSKPFLFNGNANQTSNDQTSKETNGFGAYQITEIGQLGPTFHGNSVSLTLGLPHSEITNTVSETQKNYMSDHQNFELGRRLGYVRNGEANRSLCNNQVPYATASFQNRL